jgi:hypothetical protein
MPEYYLTVALRSDTTFGRGEGLAGLVDVEIEHDEDGWPFIGGRALKGLLVEEWANLRFALGEDTLWDDEATHLFGTSGAALGKGAAQMHVGSATLPLDLRAAVTHAKKKTAPAEVLASLTTIRKQTSIQSETGAPEEGSLRAMRVLLRGTPLIARLDFPSAPNERALALLAACVLAVRRGGTARNRGRGRLSLLLHNQIPADYSDATFTQTYFGHFATEVRA